MQFYTHTLSVVLTVSNVENDAAAVRDEQTERLSGMTLQTETHARLLQMLEQKRKHAENDTSRKSKIT